MVALAIATLSVGGAERFVVRLANALCPFVDVEVWVLFRDADHALSGLLDERVMLRTNPRRWNRVSNVLWLAQLLGRVRPTVLQTFLWEADFAGALAARLTRFSRLYVSERGDRATSRRKHRLCDRCLTFPAASAAVANSSVGAADLRRSGWRRDVTVIPNGLDAMRFVSTAEAVRDRLWIPRKAEVVGMVSRVVREKGWFLLLEALAEVMPERDDLWFLAVGGGPVADDLEGRAEELGIVRRCVFVGEVQDVADHVQVLDVACLPSYGESCPNALLEYMALGRVIVAARRGGIPEVCTAPDGSSCAILVDVQTVAAYAGAVRRALSDAMLRDDLAAAALKRSRTFSMDQVAQSYLAAWHLPESVMSQ